MIGATAQDLYNAMVVLRPDDPKDELMSLALEQMKLPQKRRRVVATNHWTETSFRFTPPRKQSVSVHSTPVKKGKGTWKPTGVPDGRRHTPPPPGEHHWHRDAWCKGPAGSAVH
jgi:hypothetical protein